jgi:probable phosphoglycerate mutase
LQTILLTRHGETASNAAGIYQGQLDVPLNARGEQQAQAVAARLRGERIDAIYASDLQRAARTAEIVAEACAAPLVLDPNLRERHYGELQGLAYAAAAEVLSAHGLAAAGEGGVRAEHLPGGESVADLRRRARSFTRRLDAAHPAEAHPVILVVAHGGFLRVLLTVLLRLPATARLRFAFANCGVTRVTRDARSALLEYHNLTS